MTLPTLPAAVALFEHRGTSYVVAVEEADLPPPEGVAEFMASDRHAGTNGSARPQRSMTIRSFTIRDAATGERVFDSKEELERLLAALVPDLLDGSASDGHHRRSVTLGRINGRLFAYIRLEPLGGTAVLDLTDPRNPEFVDYRDKRRIIDSDNGESGRD